MSRRLLDASSLLILFKRRSSLFFEAVELTVLPLTIFEIGNALRNEAYLTKTTTPEKASIMLEGLSKIVGKMQSYALEADDPVKILNVSGRSGLTFYDAAYLNAALEGGFVLVTEDKKLAREAAREGVKVLSATDIQSATDL